MQFCLVHCPSPSFKSMSLFHNDDDDVDNDDDDDDDNNKLPFPF